MMDSIFRYEALDGNTVQFRPRRFAPFDGDALTRANDDSEKAYAMEVLAEEVAINGETRDETAMIRGRCLFTAEPSPYALVRGGWLPAALVYPRQFIVDRNVIAGLKAIAKPDYAERHRGFAWWMETLIGQPALLNPFTCAWEGAERRPPSFDEFCEAFDEAGAEIQRALPGAHVVRYDQRAREIAFGLMASTQARSGREAAFLTSAVPLVVDIAPRAKERALRDEILDLAQRSGVELSSLSVIAVLSCLYSPVSTGEWSIGRKILKPCKRYVAADAYNALCDFRQIELLARAQSEPGQEPFALLTCDRALAAMWCALGLRDVRQVGDESEVIFDLSVDLFPRLTIADVQGLKETLQIE